MAIASWHGKKFEITSTKILALNSLSASLELDTETNDDKAGSPPTNTKNLKLQEFDFDFNVTSAAGVDPRDEFESWKKLVGDIDVFILGTKQFGPKKMQLQKVEMSDGKLDALGNIITATISIKLVEYAPEKSKNKEKAKGSSKKSKGVKSSKSKKSKSAKASKSDKKSKKTTDVDGETEDDEDDDDEDWVSPFKGGSYRISSSPGKRGGSRTKSKDGVHYGIDMAAAKGTPVYACYSGTCTVKNSSSGYGKHVIITSEDGTYKAYYAHLSATSVRDGQHVEQGQQVGKVGATGNATGPHLHFEVRDTSKGSTRASQFVWPDELRKDHGMKI